jgi:hypothetical protein
MTGGSTLGRFNFCNGLNPDFALEENSSFGLKAQEHRSPGQRPGWDDPIDYRHEGACQQTRR